MKVLKARELPCPGKGILIDGYPSKVEGIYVLYVCPCGYRTNPSEPPRDQINTHHGVVDVFLDPNGYLLSSIPRYRWEDGTLIPDLSRSASANIINPPSRSVSP